MKQVEVHQTEWWPIWVFLDEGKRHGYTPIEVPDEVLARWQLVFEMFDLVQDEIESWAKGQPPAEQVPEEQKIADAVTQYCGLDGYQDPTGKKWYGRKNP